MDLFHVGAEDETGDHKFVNERLLEVAIPPDREDGRPIDLEDCLEEYLNTRVEVKRILERSNTQSSITTRRSRSEKPSSLSQLQVTEVNESGPPTPDGQECDSPGLSLPPPTPTVVDTTAEQNEPSSQKDHVRRPSIVKKYSFDDTETEMDVKTEFGGMSSDVSSLLRKNSRIRKEVQLPAWQISSLLRPSPIYYNISPAITNSQKPTHVLIGDIAFFNSKPISPPTTDAQVASHFYSDRPLLGICLKRYAVTEDGDAVRRDTHVELPLQVALPHFIHQEDPTLFENLKICLQSVVCHRGDSVHQGK